MGRKKAKSKKRISVFIVGVGLAGEGDVRAFVSFGAAHSFLDAHDGDADFLCREDPQNATVPRAFPVKGKIAKITHVSLVLWGERGWLFGCKGAFLDERKGSNSHCNCGCLFCVSRSHL